MDDSYPDLVKKQERDLAPYAKQSFEPSISPTFVDGGEVDKYFRDLWGTNGGRAKLENRTPVQLERDRILYSHGLRKQTEKYHVLYNGQQRIVRNYTTHTMRMAQVSRSIARGLQLNADFAEAIALGSKVGATPFVHAAKDTLADWVRKMVEKVDAPGPGARSAPKPSADSQLQLDSGASTPQWIASLNSEETVARVQKYIPWAGGDQTNDPYTAGQQSYWMLCTNPFAVEARASTFMPETMYGIWRHSRGMQPYPNSFHHRQQIKNASAGFNEIKAAHATYEATISQYADDVTWVIENLNDANTAALLNGQTSVYSKLLQYLGADSISTELLRALTNHDAGELYTYFIADFVSNSRRILFTLQDDGAIKRTALREGEEEAFIGLSEDAGSELVRMIKFLEVKVFIEPRVANRFQMLKTVSRACVDLLYKSEDTTLIRIIKNRAAVEQWSQDTQTSAENLLGDPVHRVQFAIDVFAAMSDQEIYDFVGIQAL